MAFPLKDLTSEINKLINSSKRPEREIRNLIRELTDHSFTGALTVESVTKTIAYTKRKELRDGNTIKSIIPGTGYTIALQVAADTPVTIGSDIICTICINKLDGYTHTIYAYQLESEAPEGALNRTAEQDTSEKDDKAESNTTSTDPLEKFQTEALTALSRDDTDVIFDTSPAEALLAQLQLEAEQQLKQLSDDVSETIQEITVAPAPTEAVTSNEPQAMADSENLENTQKVAEETQSQPQTEATGIQADKVSPPNENDGRDSLSANINEDTPQESVPSDTGGPGNAVSDGDPNEQDGSPQLDGDTAKTDSDSTPDVADNHEGPDLEELTKKALETSDAPITLDLLARIVSIQTGVQIKTVTAIQKAMWTQISHPNTFGEGQSRYRFPLLGKFTVRRNLDNISLDFVSSSIDKTPSLSIISSMKGKRALMAGLFDLYPVLPLSSYLMPTRVTISSLASK